MNLTLVHDLDATDCTMGVLTVFELELQTLELPWIPDPSGAPGGLKEKSRVPAGTYDLVLHDTLKHPKTWALVNRELGVIHEPDQTMPNARTACLIHSANFENQLEGCIGVGLARMGHEILQSLNAIVQLRDIVPWVAGHTLTIVDPA